MSDNYPPGMSKYRDDPRSPEYDSSKEDAYEAEHERRTNHLIESMEATGYTEREECDLIKVFADTFSEFVYKNSDLPENELRMVLMYLNLSMEVISLIAPDFSKQLDSDIEIVCADEATAWMESEDE